MRQDASTRHNDTVSPREGVDRIPIGPEAELSFGPLGANASSVVRPVRYRGQIFWASKSRQAIRPHTTHEVLSLSPTREAHRRHRRGEGRRVKWDGTCERRDRNPPMCVSLCV